MKRFFLFFFFIFLILSGIFYFTFHTTIVSQWLIKRLIAQNFSDYKVQTLLIGSQDFHFPHDLKLNNLKLILKTKKEDLFELNSRQIVLDWFKNILWAPREVQLNVHDFNLRSNNYEGQIKGEIIIHCRPDVTFAVDMMLDGLNLKQLERFNQSIFSNLEGKLYGNIHVKGNSKALNFLQVNARIIEEGKVRASMLKFFTQYLPNTKEKAALESLVKNNGKLPFEKAVFKLKSLDEHNLSGLLEMSSKTINLNLNVPVDIKIDGTWDSLIRWWQELFKKEEE